VVPDLRVEAERILGNPDLWALHGFADSVIELAAEVGRLEGELKAALEMLASTEDVEWRPEVRDFLRARGAKSDRTET